MRKTGRILLVTKEKEFRQHLQRTLERAGYSVTSRDRSARAFKDLEEHAYDLIIADYYLPDIRGKRLYEEIAEFFEATPIIFISEKADVDTIASIIDKPNADYMVRPFITEELLARIKAFLGEKDATTPKESLQSYDLILHTATFKAVRQGRTIDLSPREYELLKYLMCNQGIVLTRKMILRKVWGYSYDVSSRIVDVYIGYLREKIDNGFDEKLIETVPGFGYKLKKRDN